MHQDSTMILYTCGGQVQTCQLNCNIPQCSFSCTYICPTLQILAHTLEVWHFTKSFVRRKLHQLQKLKATFMFKCDFKFVLALGDCTRTSLLLFFISMHGQHCHTQHMHTATLHVHAHRVHPFPQHSHSISMPTRPLPALLVVFLVPSVPPSPAEESMALQQRPIHAGGLFGASIYCKRIHGPAANIKSCW